MSEFEHTVSVSNARAGAEQAARDEWERDLLLMVANPPLLVELLYMNTSSSAIRLTRCV